MFAYKCYFPCDPRVENFDDTELLNLLADLTVLIDNSDCQNVLIAGDLNCHFDRMTRFTNIVKEEIANLELELLWQQSNFNVDYTFCNILDNNAYFSTIDHFALSRRLIAATIDGGVIHSGENTSNHSAIYIKLDARLLNLKLEVPKNEKRTSWSHASIDAKENYKESLKLKLNSLPKYECVSCSDVKCQCLIHKIGIEGYTLDILEAMETVKL